MALPSVMKHDFSKVPQAEIQRSSFDRSHGFKTTFDAGYLVPVFTDEVLPGDTFTLDMTTFARLQTVIHPYMDNIYLDSFFFFIPTRLLQTNWEKLNGAQTNPGDSTAIVCPTISSGAGGYAIHSLADYFGLPTGVANVVTNSYLFRAYNLTWNEWFRDQNLQNSAVVDMDDGADTVTDYFLRRRGKRHDYFTSALPWPQKGAAVSIGFGASAPVLLDMGLTGYNAVRKAADRSDAGINNVGTAVSGADVAFQTNAQDLVIDPSGQWYADLSSATATTINSIRQAFQMQRLLERDARGGTRYTEVVKAHFGVTSPDARLQRPEYLGGGSTPVHVSVVPQTSVSAATPQGNLAGFGVASASGQGFSKSFTEHGYILGLVSARADLNYQRCVNRMWSRSTRFDFYWPALSHLGEQAVLNKEIFFDGNPGQDDAVFGYQERYAEYRYKPSLVTGKFRSDAAGTLDPWHLAIDFSALPVLGDTFIQDDPPIDRIIAVPTEPHFYLDAYFRLKCVRPMPVFGVPGLVDHF